MPSIPHERSIDDARRFAAMVPAMLAEAAAIRAEIEALGHLDDRAQPSDVERLHSLLTAESKLYKRATFASAEAARIWAAHFPSIRPPARTKRPPGFAGTSGLRPLA
jgi:hypothetical protein